MLLQSAPHTLANKLLRMISPPKERSDRELLTGFASHRDEDAFAELVRRHGRMVLAVTRRVTGHSQDAEDAFQAAFLVLARRAGQIERPELLANWLYGVAYHTAREARASRRRVLEQSVASLPETLASSPPEHNDELGRVIDEEVAALPDKYRCAVVLCDLQGLSRATAARQMKIPEGTLSSRLAYARKLLAAKLTRRGITSTSGGVLALLGGEVNGVVLPREMVILTARVAAQTRIGGLLPPELVSPTVSHLTEGVLKMMFVNRWQLTLTTACMTCRLLALGA